VKTLRPILALLLVAGSLLLSAPVRAQQAPPDAPAGAPTSPAMAPSASAASSVAAAGAQGDLGFVRLVVNNKAAVEVFPAFIDDRERPFLQFDALMRALEVPVRFDASLGAALGFLPDGTTRFNLNLERATVLVGDTTHPLPPEAYRLVDQTLYVRYDAVARWIPLELDWSVQAYQVTIRTHYPLPSTLREQREAQRVALAEQKAEAPTAARLARNVPWFDPGMFELDTTASGGHNNPDQLKLTLKGVQRFLKGDLEYSLSETRTNGRSHGQIDYGRLTWYDPLRTWQVQLGDTYSGFSTLLVDPLSFTGGSFYTGGPPLGFGRTSLIGTAPSGSEVDLYRQGVLLDFTTADAQGFYRFQSVPLALNTNLFEVHIYTPDGRKLVEYREVAAQEQVLRQGALATLGGAGQGDQGVSRYDVAGGEVRYGLLPSVTVGGYALQLHNYFDVYETIADLNAVGAFALWRPVPWMIVLGEQARDGAVEGAGTRMSAFLAFQPISLELEQRRYTGDFAPPNRTRSTAFSVPARADSISTVGARMRVLDVNLDLRTTLSDFGASRRLSDQQLRADRRFTSHLSAFATLERERSREPGLAQGGFDQQQVLATYSLAPLERLEAFVLNRTALGADRTSQARISWLKNALAGSPWSWEASYIAQSPQDDLVVGAVGYLFPRYNVRLSARAQSDGTWLLLAEWAQPFRVADQGLERLPEGTFGRGGLEGDVYVDANVNGRRDPGESGVSGVQLLAPGIPGLRTDANGHFRGWGLPSGSPTLVDVNLLTADALNTPAQKHQYLTAHPGELVHRDIALVPSSGMDGTLRFAGQAPGGISPADGLHLLLRNSDGGVVATARVEWDGAFIFEHVPPGTYTVEAEPKGFAERGLALQPGSYRVDFPPSTDPAWRSGVALQLVRTSTPSAPARP